MNKGILYTALSGTLYGSIGYFGSQLMAQGLSVRDLLLWRFLFSTALLLPFLPSFWKHRATSPVNVKALLILLFLGGAVYGSGTALYFESSKLIGTGLAMVIFFTYPIFVVGMSACINKTPLNRVTLISVALIVVGCSMIAFEQNMKLDLTGILLAILSAVAYAIYVFWSKKTTSVLPPVLATLTVCMGGTLAFIAYIVAVRGAFFVPSTSQMWVHISLFSLIGTVLPVLLLLAGLKYISANKASIISVLEPVTTLGVGAIVLEEAVSPLQLLGSAIILSSAMIIQLDKEKAA